MVENSVDVIKMCHIYIHNSQIIKMTINSKNQIEQNNTTMKGGLVSFSPKTITEGIHALEIISYHL